MAANVLDRRGWESAEPKKALTVDSSCEQPAHSLASGQVAPEAKMKQQRTRRFMAEYCEGMRAKLEAEVRRRCCTVPLCSLAASVGDCGVCRPCCGLRSWMVPCLYCA